MIVLFSSFRLFCWLCKQKPGVIIQSIHNMTPPRNVGHIQLIIPLAYRNNYTTTDSRRKRISQSHQQYDVLSLLTQTAGWIACVRIDYLITGNWVSDSQWNISYNTVWVYSFQLIGRITMRTAEPTTAITFSLIFMLAVRRTPNTERHDIPTIRSCCTKDTQWIRTIAEEA